MKNLSLNYEAFFNALPDLYLLLTPDFCIAGATDSYLKATLTVRKNILGQQLFEVFPDNPDDHTANGVSNLKISLETVLATRAPHNMDIQKYDIRRPDGVFEERYWSPVNSPVLDNMGNVTHIVHRVVDVTEAELLKREVNELNTGFEKIEQAYRESIRESEDRFMKIFNMNPISIFITESTNGKILYANDAFHKLFSAGKQSVIGKTVVELGMTSFGQRSETIRKIEEAGGIINEMDLTLRDVNGDIKKLVASTTTFRIDQKNCFITAMINISERKRIEEELKKTNDFLDNVLENIPAMVFVKEASSKRYLRLNCAGEHIFGKSRAEVIGKSDFELFDLNHAKHFDEMDNQVINSGKLHVAEERVPAKGGDRWLRVQKIPVYDGNKALFLIGIAEDITERKHGEEAIEQLNNDLESFTYSVSHDLRAPLRAVTGFAKMLEEDYCSVLDTEGLRLLGTISQNAERMGLLIDDLLSFSKLGKKKIAARPTDLAEIAHSVVKEFVAVFPAAVVNIEPIHPAHCDPALMRQVFMNIIGNALKYSSKNKAPKVHVTSADLGEMIQYAVADNGVGFDMRYVDKLFHVFQRLHSTEEFEGTGVGLAIVRRIVSKHGGTAWAHSTVGVGSTFYFTMPKINNQ